MTEAHLPEHTEYALDHRLYPTPGIPIARASGVSSMRATRIVLRRRARGRRRQPAGIMRGLLGLAAVLTLFAAAITTAVAGVTVFTLMQQYRVIADTVLPAEAIVAGYSHGGAKVLDRHGAVLYEFVDEFVGLRRPVRLDTISPWMIDATVAVEDPDFWTNSGINLRGTMRAGVENFAPFLVGSTEFLEGTGGSSITQQLARNVYMTREERELRSVERKLREMVIARELTRRYSKEQILEWYLNLLPYGGIYVGIEAAAQGYFGKPASELNLAESSLLVGIPQSPARYNPYASGNIDPATLELRPTSPARARQAEVLSLMVAAGTITSSEAFNALQQPLDFRQARFDIEAPHFVLGRIASEITARFGHRALYEGGLEVVTTLDLGLQQTTEEILDRNIREFGEQANLHNGAYIALDPHTGQILVYVGSRDYFDLEIEGNNDNVVARNSPGSTLKPFTFLTAFTQGWGTGRAILDTPLTIPDGVGGEFTPRNPGTGFQGPVTAAVALGNSFNITAIKVMMAVGVPETIAMYQRLGYTTLDNPGGYGPALTTGGGEITLMDQAIAYSVLATGGVMRGQKAIVTPDLAPGGRTLEPIALLRVSDWSGSVLYQFDEPAEERIVDEAFAYLVTSILSDPQNTCITYSACGALALPDGYPSVAKTGTSEPYETQGLIGETWTMGYTPHLVSGIWAGNADNDPIRGITSTTVALRAWKEFMVAASAHLALPPTPFVRPATVVERQVCWPSGLLVTPDCPEARRYQSLYAASVLPSRISEGDDMYDHWWQRNTIDQRTGLVASAQTPPSASSSVIQLIMPAEEIRAWPGLHSWAAAHRVGEFLGVAPTASDGPLIAEVRSPASGQTVTGEVSIVGRAASDGFASYTVEWARSAEPEAWRLIKASDQSVGSGLLTTWDTRALPNGEYLVRLTVRDAEIGTRRFTIPVRVGNSTEPYAVIDFPVQGSEVTGSVTIIGSATADRFVAYAVEAGEGSAPTSWETVVIGDRAVFHGVLATWETFGLTPGVWTIRLTVVDGSGRFTVHEMRVVVASGVGAP
jgi:membrane peptidoglycan carboxypeptidase